MASKLSNLKVGEVSFCVKGMNQHARVALFKSVGGPELPSIVKATFDEALAGSMIAGKVSEAFYESFNGLWERNDAFREALTDELAEGGDGSVASDAYVASVKSLVETAVASARDAGATASDTAPIDKAFTAAADQWVAAKSQPKEQDTMPFTNKAALLATVAKFDPAKTTVAEVAEIQKAAADFGCVSELPVALAPAAPSPELAKALTEIAVLKMGTDVRKHYDGLSDTDKTAFLAKSAEDQAADVAKANAVDPVVFTTSGGFEIRKSDGRAAEIMARENDELRKSVNLLVGKSQENDLEARAGRFPNVAKSVAIDMLKSIDQLGAESDAGKAVAKSLKQMNGVSKTLFTNLGSTEGEDGHSETSIQKAQGDFNAKVAEIQKRDNLGMADAMSKARREHADLHKAAYPAPVDEDADA